MTSSRVEFRVLGVAAAKGNMKAFPFKRQDGRLGAVVTEGTRNSKAWQIAVRGAAQQQCHGTFFDGAVRLGIVFFLPRPQSLPKKVKHHIKKPDCSKLLRTVEDALTGVLWRDDSQVVQLVVQKTYATTQPHVIIRVEPAEVVEEAASQENLFAVFEEVRA